MKPNSVLKSRFPVTFERMRYLSVALFAIFIGSGCGANFLEQTADKETPNALIFEAKRLMNERQYAEAITSLERLPASKLAEREIVVLRSSAYAGRCGLDFINLVDAVQSNDGASSILALLLLSMKSASAFADCRTAEDLLEAAGATGAARTKDENFLMAFISFAKIGAILAATGNADDDDDGVADAGFNACVSLTRVDAAEIGSSLGIAVDSIASSGSTLFSGEITNISSVCSLIGSCGTDPSDFDDTARDAIRTAIHDDDGSFGLATQDPGSDVTKICSTDGT